MLIYDKDGELSEKCLDCGKCKLEEIWGDLYCSENKCPYMKSESEDK